MYNMMNPISLTTTIKYLTKAIKLKKGVKLEKNFQQLQPWKNIHKEVNIRLLCKWIHHSWQVSDTKKCFNIVRHKFVCTNIRNFVLQKVPTSNLLSVQSRNSTNRWAGTKFHLSIYLAAWHFFIIFRILFISICIFFPFLTMTACCCQHGHAEYNKIFFLYKQICVHICKHI